MYFLSCSWELIYSFRLFKARKASQNLRTIVFNRKKALIMRLCALTKKGKREMHYILVAILLIGSFGCSEEELLRKRSAPPEVEEIFTQESSSKIDILWVIDNSESIADEREFIANGFDSFLNTLKTTGFDYRLAITSTETGTGLNGKLAGEPISNSSSDPVADFKKQLGLEPSKTNQETGLRAMELALNGSVNQNFPRPDAALAVVIVSDEDDYSKKGTTYYARFLLSLKKPGDENLVKFSAIVGPKPDGCIRPGEEIYFEAKSSPGKRYLELVDKMLGLSTSICSTNFGEDLNKIAASISNLKTKFCASRDVGEIITVAVNGTELEANKGWILEKSTSCVVFTQGNKPAPGATIFIKYKTAGSL